MKFSKSLTVLESLAVIGSSFVVRAQEDEHILRAKARDQTLTSELKPDLPEANPKQEITCIVEQAEPEGASDFFTNPDIPPPQPADPVEGFCANFDDKTLQGFDKCPGFYDNIMVKNSASGVSPDSSSGPTGSSTDYYLHLRDLSHASLACGQGNFVGDWTDVAKMGCSELCFDMKIFYDGCWSSSSPAQCPGLYNSNRYVPITPRIILQGGPMNYYRAVFKASFTINDNKGPRQGQGWHKICAPIGPLDKSGNLPSNSNGTWAMASYPCNYLGGVNCAPGIVGIAPNSEWNTLLSDIRTIALPIDPTSNPAERFGYDNICIKPQECPPPCEPEPLCHWKYDWDCKELSKNKMWPGILRKYRISTFRPDVCVCEVLNQCCPDRCDMAEQEFMALLLNIAYGKLGPECCVLDSCGRKTTVLQMVRLINRLLAYSSRSDYACSMATFLASGINEGTRLCRRIGTIAVGMDQFNVADERLEAPVPDGSDFGLDS